MEFHLSKCLRFGMIEYAKAKHFRHPQHCPKHDRSTFRFVDSNAIDRSICLGVAKRYFQLDAPRYSFDWLQNLGDPGRLPLNCRPGAPLILATGVKFKKKETFRARGGGKRMKKKNEKMKRNYHLTLCRGISYYGAEQYFY